jgi:hypothetical protein
MPRTGSGGRGKTILNADVRPYRDNAAAASGQDGHGIDHGRGYKAALCFRQDDRRRFTVELNPSDAPMGASKE